MIAPVAWIHTDAVPPSPSDDQRGQPVFATVERCDTGIRVRLVGRSPHVVHVRYTLTAASNGNAATQSGSATLLPDHPATLLDLTQTDAADWSATLNVTVEGGNAYTSRIARPDAGQKCGAPD